MSSTSSESPNVYFRMLREHMAGVPCFELPAGYRFRAFREGDDVVWMDLHIAGEPFVEMTPALFADQFRDGLDLLSERMVFVETLDGLQAGSITAWWEKERYAPDERGRIHWVIVHPQHRRRGIAKAMMTRAMATLAESHRWAMLETSSGRPFAVKMYLDFGFVPDPDELNKPEILAAWRRVQTTLNHPALATVLMERASPGE